MLGITVLLSQLPLLFHFPLWLSLPALALVIAKLKSLSKNNLEFPPLTTIVFVLVAIIAVFFHYGHIFGRDPCVAFLFLLVSFKYIETKRNYDASLLVILCAFLLLTQFFFQQTLIASVLSIPAMYFVGLSLFALQRAGAPTDTRAMMHITAKLFLQAIPIATLLFVAVPRIAQAPWSGANNGQAQTGLSARMSPGSIASLSKSDEVAFRVEFEGAPPPIIQRYWRGPVLTGYDGHDWFVFPGNLRSESAPTSQGRPLEYTVTMSPNYQPWLLALDTPQAKPALLNNKKRQVWFNHELQIDTDKPIDQPLRYRAKSHLSDRFTPQFPPGSENLITTSTNPRSRGFARELRSQYPDDLSLVNALLQWYNKEPFHYTLSPPRLGNHSIDNFMFDTRSGFCEHYAGSFVFLLRAAGIPARVVTGYQGGEMSNDYMIVRQSDAHAWAEVYIKGEWIRFDPTAAVAPERVEQGVGEALRSDPSRNFLDKIEIPLLNSVALQWDAVNFAWQRMIIGFDNERQAALWKKLGIDKPSGWMIVIAVALIAGVWALLILKPLTGFWKKPVAPCERYWRKLAKRLEAQGFKRASGETHSQYIARACKQWPQHRKPLQTLIQSYNHGTYAQGDDHTQLQMAGLMKSALGQIKKL